MVVSMSVVVSNRLSFGLVYVYKRNVMTVAIGLAEPVLFRGSLATTSARYVHFHSNQASYILVSRLLRGCNLLIWSPSEQPSAWSHYHKLL